MPLKITKTALYKKKKLRLVKKRIHPKFGKIRHRTWTFHNGYEINIFFLKNLKKKKKKLEIMVSNKFGSTF